MTSADEATQATLIETATEHGDLMSGVAALFAAGFSLQGAAVGPHEAASIMGSIIAQAQARNLN